MVGISGGLSLSEYSHPDLSAQADLTAKSIENFGATVESLLIKFNKNIIGEFWIPLCRL